MLLVHAHAPGCNWCPDGHGGGYCFNQACTTTAGNGTALADSAKPTDFYMVRNSWGDTWGLAGYIAMARNADNQCGIATDAIYIQ